MKKFSFILLVFSIFSVPLFAQNIDIRLLRLLDDDEVQPGDPFFKFVSNSNSYVILAVPATMGVTGLVRHDKEMFRNACMIVGAGVVNFGITYVMKYSINRKRPYEMYPDIIKKSDGGSPSFPSGHTSGAFATATSLSLAYPKWYIVVPSYLWASTVAYSRMDLGVHYPSDVLIGALVGSGSAYLCYKLNQKLHIMRR